MPALQKKQPLVERMRYQALPDAIKDVLGSPDNVAMTTNIIREAGLTEEFRPYINTVVFGLFVGELHPKLLVHAVKEWLAIDEAKAHVVAALIKKTFIDPFQSFLDSVYQETLPLKAPKPSLVPPVPQGNVVNLKSTNDRRPTTNDYHR